MNAPAAEYEQLINNVQTPTFLVLDIFEKYLEGEEVYEKIFPFQIRILIDLYIFLGLYDQAQPS